MRVIKCIPVILVLACCGCKLQPKLRPLRNGEAIGKVVTEMTDIMVHDITNPPLAARFFAYACLSGYEVVVQNDTAFKSMHGLLNEYPAIQVNMTIQPQLVQLSALLAMMETAKKMQPSATMMDDYELHFIDSCKSAGYSRSMIKRALGYATLISKQVLQYAANDRYNRISNFARYSPLQKDGYWYPTPPAYLSAVEPYFKTVRPFTLDSSSQFAPAPPVPFSADSSSAFFALMQKNVDESENDDPDHRVIAAFWDCNPFAVQNDGHLMLGLKKISPGAHWMGITGIACAKAGKNFGQSMQIYTLVATGLMDAFICCWDEKYRSNRIRPETAIRKYIDPRWMPLLQTPPFPEYLSGHSVVSACSATILTHFFGRNFSYADDVELPYGLAARTFNSFDAAAEEAAISRFYGGIHFMDAITNGLIQGKKVGEQMITKVIEHLK